MRNKYFGLLAFAACTSTASTLTVPSLRWLWPRNITSPNSGTILFDSQIPKHHDALPLFALAGNTRFPEKSLPDVLKSAGPAENLITKKEQDGLYYYNADRLVGFYDFESGETAVLPELGSLRPGAEKINLDTLAALAKDRSIIPIDDTSNSIVIGSRLGGSRQKSGNKPTAPETYLAQGIIRREINYEKQAHPVCGPGSRGLFSFGADGNIKGMTHKWRSAKSTGLSVAPLAQGDIQKRIAAQLAAANLTTGVTVRGVELCFYDSGSKYIQPVFRFNATIATSSDFANRTVLGYIPAGGEEYEPLPTLKLPPGVLVPNANTNTTAAKLPARQRRNDGVTVGRYLMANDDISAELVPEGWALMNGLTASAPGRFVDSQYYWDSPYTYRAPEASHYIDAVNVAFSDGHANVHRLATDDKAPDRGRVYIPSSLPPNGYGRGGGGQLAYWLIGGCLVVSTPPNYSEADRHLAFEPWWQVFNGLHAVVGYRSDSYTNVDAMGRMAKALGKGASVVHGWMDNMLPAGTTSAVTVCGHDGDNVYQIENIGRPLCLQIWWYHHTKLKRLFG
jgi:hypothetical protein